MSPLASTALNWVTFDAEDIRKAKEILDELMPDSTVDSIGLGLPFEAISDVLFPGTSTLHTRLRYQIFVASIMYRMFADKYRNRSFDPKKRMFDHEVGLMRKLCQNMPNSTGIIGKVAGDGLKYWPSMTYWGGINAVQMFGADYVTREDLYDEINRIGELEDGDENKKSDLFGNITLREIAFALFPDRKVQKNVTFDLTKKEAVFYKNQLREVAPDTLLTQWTNMRLCSVEPFESFMDVTPIGHEQLDSVINEAKHYSRVAMGVTHAYRAILCHHRASRYEKTSDQKHEEWLGYSETNRNHLARWLSENKSLASWDIGSLKSALKNYRMESAIDHELGELVTKFISLWDRGAEGITESFREEVIAQERGRRGNRSHFVPNSETAIPDNAKGHSYSASLFNFRFAQGRRNAVDIIKGLNRRAR
jgi:hypothetical protein